MSKFEERLHKLQAMSEYRYSNLEFERIRTKLDANENWHIPELSLRDLTKRVVEEFDVREYPLRIVTELQNAIANHLKIPPESVIPTQGADQGIDLLCQMFLRQNDRVVTVGPTYSFYELRTEIAEAQTVETNMNSDLSLPVENILTRNKDAAILFLCSPNNPTGNQFSTADILRVCDAFEGLVVLDEAYVEFARENLAQEILSHKNLAILRTFSKAFGLANLRLGFILANPEWASLFLERVQYPYPISSLVAATAIRLLEKFQLVQNAIESVKSERSWFLKQLRSIKEVKALDSQANFILVSLPLDADSAHRQLLERGVATKKIGQVLDIPNCLRVTVGTREMNLTFLEGLNEVLSNA
ncbi:MAG TPA: histidinol-phosphate transaminase [Candidatus Bathyarchaeia archaeon]|nr:histidinol-phosphate transaminase [Candidatus Bathyarchaeia archaeon]